MRRLEGNGESKVTINVSEKRKGYVIIAPDRIDKLPSQTPVYISLTLENWQKEHPGVHVRAVCPIVADGVTIALHVWYDS